MTQLKFLKKKKFNNFFDYVANFSCIKSFHLNLIFILWELVQFTRNLHEDYTNTHLT